MEASRGYDSRSDAELASQAGAGDQAAFAAIYERHFAGIYDFAVRTVREPDAAADVVRNTFSRAWDGIRKRKGRRFGDARLYCLARDSAIAELKRPRPAADIQPTPVASGRLPFAQLDTSRLAGEQPDAEEQATASIVWDSATAFSPKQYSLLDMHLRRGLRADQLAEVLHFDENAIYIMLYRLREALVRSTARTLLLTRGRSECRDLDGLLAEMGTESDKSRRAIDDHMRSCARCQAAARRYPSALKVFAGLAWVEPGPGVQAAVRRDILAYASGLLAPHAARRLQPRGLWARREPGPRRRSVPLIAAAGAATFCIIAILVAGVIIFGTGGGGAPITSLASARRTPRSTSPGRRYRELGPTRCFGATGPKTCRMSPPICPAMRQARRAPSSHPAPGISTSARRETMAPGPARCTSGRSR